jgi:hypothetical protein
MIKQTIIIALVGLSIGAAISASFIIAHIIDRAL